MAKKELKIDDILTKIKAGFRGDVYIINNMYCIPGPHTSDNLVSSIVLVFNQEVIDVFNTLFPDTKYTHILDMNTAKNDLLGHVAKINNDDISYCDEYIKNIVPVYDKIETWKEFNFTEKDMEDFKDGKSIELKEQNESLSNLSFGKNVLPFISNTKLNDIVYNISKTLIGLTDLNTKYIMDYFQVYNMITFLNY